MKVRTTVRVCCVLAVFTASALLLHSKNSAFSACVVSTNAESANPLAMAATCEPQQSWFNWLQGNSRSTQFHFVDLLELLNRFDHTPSQH